MAKKGKNTYEWMTKDGKPFTGERVTLCQDGKYRWIYDVVLLKNPTIFFDVLKVMALSIGITVAIVMLLGLAAQGFSWDMFEGMMIAMGITAAIILGVTLISYPIYALHVGFKYTVLFTLDEHELVSQQYGKSLEKGQLIGELGIIAGILTANPRSVGRGLLVKSNTAMVTELEKVRRVIPHRWLNTIKVNKRFYKNRVYLKQEDFDFVYDFLCQHCPNRKR